MTGAVIHEGARMHQSRSARGTGAGAGGYESLSARQLDCSAYCSLPLTIPQIQVRCSGVDHRFWTLISFNQFIDMSI